MKRATIYIVAFFVIIIYNNSFAQLAESSWSFGFGVKYPRFLSSGLVPKDLNFGSYACLERDFTEHMAFRLNTNFLHMEGTNAGITQKTNLLSLNYEVLYKMLPCEAVSPFAFAGLGNILYKFDQTFANQYDNKLRFDYQVNFGVGAEWRIGEDWNLLTEMDYHTVSANSLDGINNPGNGLLGGISDTYLGMKIGFQYYFSKGEPSKLCNVYSGLSSVQQGIDYDRIEGIIRKYTSKPLETIDYNKIEDIVKKYQPTTVSGAAVPAENWILVGVTFNMNSAKFKIEAYPILYHAAQVLLQNPDLKVEIQGYTDDTGPDMFNLNLSLQRANAVRDYLTAHGVAAERLSAVGYGSKNPVADNKTAAGRILNRRIEFKILNK